jgi:tetratricopeptide (TPR) repeat protein
VALAISIIFLISLLVGLLPNNLAAIQKMRAALSGVSIAAVDQINQRCRQAEPLYAEKRYQEVIDMTLAIWLTTPDVDLKLSTCRQSVQNLAVSLQTLKKLPELEIVHRKVVSLGPSYVDEVAFFSWLGLGDIAVQKQDWREAAADYSLANQISLRIATSNLNRVRVWNRIVSLVDAYAKVRPLAEFIIMLQNMIPASDRKQGLWIQVGLTYEHLQRYPEALVAFQEALKADANDPYLEQTIQRIARLVN